MPIFSIKSILRNEQKRQRYFLVVFAIVLSLIFLVRWQWFGKKATAPAVNIPEISYREINLDFNILENPALQELKRFELIPPLGVNPGRQNPFLPF